ncbi:hypothetical protein YC2023_118915 [Brassica napus]
MSCWLLHILIISSLHLISPSSQQETSFVYENFSSQENLYLDKSAKVLPSGLLQLTSALDHQIGHAFYKKPIQFSSSGPVSFSTHFVCAMVPRKGIEGGHGIAFLVSPSMDFSHAQAKRFLGAFNASTNGSQVLAVELDTLWNPEFKDTKSNHVGIDVNNPISIGVAPASYYSDMNRKNESINLLSGKPVQVWVDYDGTMLNVSIAPLKVKKPSRPLLSHPINLSEIFPNTKLFVGFSAATGNAVSGHYIIWWSFSTSRGSLQPLDISRLVEVPHSSAPHKKLPIILLISNDSLLEAVLVNEPELCVVMNQNMYLWDLGKRFRVLKENTYGLRGESHSPLRVLKQPCQTKTLLNSINKSSYFLSKSMFIPKKPT